MEDVNNMIGHEMLASMTTYDYVIVGLLVLLIGRGIWLGMIRQVTGLLGLYLGFFFASQYHDKIFPVLRDISSDPKVVFLTTYVVLFIVTYLLVMLLGKGLKYVFQLTIAPWFDRLIGGLIGFAKAVVLTVLIHMILGTILAPENQMLQDCTTCNALNKATGFSRALINDEEVRESLLRQPPAIAVDAVKEYFKPDDESKDSTQEEREE